MFIAPSSLINIPDENTEKACRIYPHDLETFSDKIDADFEQMLGQEFGDSRFE